MPEKPARSATPVAKSHQRVKLARKWANLITSSTFVPLPPAEFDDRLEKVVDHLVGAVLSEPFAPHLAIEDGASLVEFGCTGPSSLQFSLDVLGKGLLALPELAGSNRFAERVVLVLGNLASGYSEAIRFATLEQQETMSRALLRALTDSRHTVRRVETRFEHVVANSANGIALTERDGRLVRANDRLAEILGYPTADDLTKSTLFDLVHTEDTTALREAYAALADGSAQRVQHEQLLRRADGENAWATLTLSVPQPVDADSVFVAVVEDHTELNLLHRQLNHQALHDMLTRLPNRQFLSTRLERAIRHADPVNGITLYHLDLDAFSLITHGLGRPVGDRLLESVAARLQVVFAEEEAMVARVGPDEFAVLVENSPTTPGAVRTVHQINEELSQPFYVEDHGIASPASIGVVDRPPAGMDAAALLEAAELTLARAKRNGRTQWALFDPFQDARDRAEFSLAASLPGAWETGQFSVSHRPLVTLDGRQVVGTDALLSWQHPKHGRLPHQRCAELAEETGLIMPIGRWVLRSACELTGDLPRHVGLTPSQSADPDLIAQVLEILEDTGLPPERLWLGIPASALTAPGGDAVDNLRLLAGAGVRTEILEFGTTAADLAHLEDLPADAVRIAPWMVRRQERPDRDESLVTKALADILAIVHLAGATVTVEDVDTDAQADRWLRLGADLAQGSFHSG